jgi:flagellar basal-body rod modification protein FlgD
MDTSAVNSSTSSSAASVAGQQLAGNFDTFLKLLTTQLQYQDPTAPMDSSQFTQQLVQFASVEQTINSNKNLEQLVNLSLASSTSAAAGYIGKQVTAGGSQAALANGAAHWTYTLGANAASTVVNVTDAGGTTVYTSKGELTSGVHTFNWDGRTNDGGTAPDGTYTISVTAADNGGNKINTGTTVTGVVSAVDIVSGKPALLVGGIDIDPADITRTSISRASFRMRRPRRIWRSAAPAFLRFPTRRAQPRPAARLCIRAPAPSNPTAMAT